MTIFTLGQIHKLISPVLHQKFGLEHYIHQAIFILAGIRTILLILELNQ